MATGNDFGTLMGEQALAFAKWKREEDALAFFEDRPAAPVDADFEKWLDEMEEARRRDEDDAAWLDLYYRTLHPVSAEEAALWTGEAADAEMPHAAALDKSAA